MYYICDLMKHRNIQLPVIIDDSNISSYLTKIHKFPFLTEKEEYDLATLWREKQDVNAAQRLVSAHLRMVPKIAGQYKGYGLPMMDLISEGNIGLMLALKKYEPKMGYRFSTYAMWWVKATIQDYILRSWSMVKITSTAAQKKLFFNLRQLQNKINNLNLLENKNIDEAEYIAQELNVDKADVVEMDQRFRMGVVSLNSSDSDMQSELIDSIPCEKPTQEMVLVEQNLEEYKKRKIIQAMQMLNERERQIIIARKLNDKAQTLDELSQKFKVSKERIRQIEASALKKMKEYLQNSFNDAV